jgi:2-keto-3-deoxy-L-fuconate dehydrogenase
MTVNVHVFVDAMLRRRPATVRARGRRMAYGRLNGKAALVTAAGEGIGRAIAEAFLHEGAVVHATDIDVRKLEGLDSARCAQLDASSLDAIAALHAAIGDIDILVNAAGFVDVGTVLDCSQDSWDRSISINVRSVHGTLQTFLPGMLARKNGSIVNIASTAGPFRGLPNRYIYSITKAAVVGLTRQVAADYVRSGIRVNAICPGTIESPSQLARMRDEATRTNRPYQEVHSFYRDRQPIGRMGTPAEVAATAVFLASDEASFTTGQAVIVDGGLSL